MHSGISLGNCRLRLLEQQVGMGVQYSPPLWGQGGMRIQLEVGGVQVKLVAQHMAAVQVLVLQRVTVPLFELHQNLPK